MGKEYLGDGVYADIDGQGNIRLTAENGMTASDTILLEPEVAKSFIEYCVRVKERLWRSRYA